MVIEMPDSVEVLSYWNAFFKRNARWLEKKHIWR